MVLSAGPSLYYVLVCHLWINKHFVNWKNNNELLRYLSGDRNDNNDYKRPVDFTVICFKL